MVVSLAFGAPALAQDASPVPAQDEVLYEITVPPEAIPDSLGKIVVDEWTVAPGTDVSIPYDNEGILGRGMYLESGGLTVTPAYDALLWTGEAVRGGSPVIAPAAEEVALAAGDVLLLPAVPRDQLDPTAEVGIANPGTSDAQVFAFHMHWWESFPGWPEGIRSTPGITFGWWDELTRVSGGDTTFRLTRLSAQPGEALPFPDDAAFVFDYLKSGALSDWTILGSGPTERAVDVERKEHIVAGDVPAEVLELAVIPSVEVVAAEPEASSPRGNAWVTGTVACTVTTDWTTTMVEGVEQLRGRDADCKWFASDPRMTGPFSLTQDMDCYEDSGWACVLWATFEGSGWTGSLVTPVDPSGVGTDHIIQTGTGANEGLVFVGTNTPEGWSGLLYEGDPPPSGPLPSPASE